MTSCNYISLHNHSHYSLLDGMCSPAEIAQHAKKLGHTAVSITDHGTMSGVIELYTACKSVDIKPIIGLEAYIAPKSRSDRDYKRVKGEAMPYGHITLLAKNNTGYKNLIKLSTLSYTEGYYYKPRVDLEILDQHKQGIICLTGCTSALTSKMILAGNIVGAAMYITNLYDIFGDDLYIELMDTGQHGQRVIINELSNIIATVNIPMVATNDVHFLTPDDILAHQTLLCIGYRKPLAEMRNNYVYRENWFKSYQDMNVLFHDKILQNTVAIAEKCNVSIALGKIDTTNHQQSYGIIRDKCEQQIGQYSTRHRDRLRTELEAIDKTGYAEYILTVYNFVQHAKAMGIPIGSGRGSASGSLVCYLLGITEIDPLEYGLLFERFINVNRIEPPDIDIDVCQARRGEVIDFLKDEYGADRVSQITSFGKLKTKALLKDICRVLGLPFQVGDKITKLLPEPWEGTVEEALKIPDIQRELSPQIIQQLKEIGPRLEGKPRHTSTHAAGIVISPQPLSDTVPLYVRNENLLTQYDMYSIGTLGLLKFDVLGLRTLTVISDACELAGIDISTIPLDDKTVYGKISNGNTIGIFQYEGYGYTRFIRRMRPRNFTDLIALGALFRPGPINLSDDYINRMHGKERYVCEDDFLEETYGIMLYQEQVMLMVQKHAGFTLNEADILRKAIGKKDEKLMDKMLARIKDKDLCNKIVTFARYGWNKSHSVGYALLSYRTAYLKYNYPIEYFCALLNSEISDQKRISTLIDEARKCGVIIDQPHINISEKYFTIFGNKIYSGLLSVHGIGSKSCDAVLQDRETNGYFKNEQNLRERIQPRVLNSVAYKALINANTFRPLPAGINELHLDIRNCQPIDLLQIRAIVDENAGTSKLYMHNNGQVITTNYKVNKTKMLISRLNTLCNVIQ